MKKKIIDLASCTGCKNCELACIAAHCEDKVLNTPLTAYLSGVENAPRPRNKVELDGEGRRFPQFCRHCDEPACVEACQSGALTKRDDGLVVCDEERCVGCYMCVMSCPYGNARPSMGGDKIMIKCDGCVDRECMACAAACPEGCITVGEEGNEAVEYVNCVGEESA
jgi:carbon-monoxide dehydrogenase iron sulfur subunit